ncbi:coth protein-domain-containing protein [Neocallimastix sp. 'constans']
MGYNCCKGCTVYIEDQSGQWGYENHQWCGIDDKVCKDNNCWSLPEYPCCEGNSIVTSDSQGDWGYENNHWCGIIKKEVNDCWSLPDYPCCEGNTIVTTDSHGDWGYENNHWCGILKQTGEKDPSTGNPEETPVDPMIEDVPIFSMESGYYEASDNLNLTLSSSGTIYYTLDSSDPTTSSTAKVYEGEIKMYDKSVDNNVYSMYQHEENSPYSITIHTGYKASTLKHDKVTVIRATTKLKDGTFSPVITKTYFVMDKEKLQFYSDITVVSLVTDPSNLFDKDKGIYVLGQQYLDWKKSPKYNPRKSEWDSDNITNFFSKGKEWERNASFTLFRHGKEEMVQEVGIRIKGASTRNSNMKSFNIYARKEYGKSKFKYEVIEDNKSVIDGKPITKYDSFSLRHSNWLDRMRESVVQRGLKDFPILATLDNSKCLVFLDGEFWGLYDLIEKPSDFYIKSNYDIPTENVALIKNDILEEGTEEDLNDLTSLVEFCAKNDLRDEVNYNYVAEKVDVESLIYSYASGLYLGIWDWPNRNYLVYRNKGEPIEGNDYGDGKWKYGAFDFDYSAGITFASFGGVPGYAHDSFKKFQSAKDIFPTPIFDGMIKNPKFYKRFGEVMHLMEEEIFNPEKMKKIVEEQKSKYLDYIVKNDWRWHNGTPKKSWEAFREAQNKYYSDGWDVITEFFERRPQYVYQFMEKTYGKYK